MYDEDDMTKEIRRLRYAEGMTCQRIGKVLGLSTRQVELRIKKLYGYTPPPTRPTLRDWLDHKRNSPWVPEDGIVDPVAIRRAVENEGCPVRVTRNEAIKIIEILSSRGVGSSSIARRIGVKAETVKRIMNQHGIERAETPRDYVAPVRSTRSIGDYVRNYGRGRKVA